jgi:hypothetical protein
MTVEYYKCGCKEWYDDNGRVWIKHYCEIHNPITEQLTVKP